MKGKYPRKTREHYELWWEYLKRSEGYKNWLESGASKEYRAWLQKVQGWKPGDPPLTVPVNISSNGKWTRLYDRFGDVHRTLFDKWWKTKGIRLQKQDALVEYADHWLAVDLDQCFANVKGRQGKDFPERFKAHFIERLKTADVLTLLVDPLEDLDVLMRKFKDLVNKRRRARPERLHRSMAHSRPYGKIDPDKLSAYLKVYEMKNQPTPPSNREIAKLIFPLDVDGEPLARRVKEEEKGPMVKKEIGDAIRQYYKLASIIIENAERGDFPGEYSPRREKTTARKRKK